MRLRLPLNEWLRVFFSSVSLLFLAFVVMPSLWPSETGIGRAILSAMQFTSLFVALVVAASGIYSLYLNRDKETK